MSDEYHEVMDVADGRPVKCWTRGVPVEAAAREQLSRMARLPFIYRHVAVMPDVHVGIGATVGSVIATRGAIIPAAVGVDIGCGMTAIETSLTGADLPDSLSRLRSRIEQAVPHGLVTIRDRSFKGAWAEVPEGVLARWGGLAERLRRIIERYPKVSVKSPQGQLGTLGGGNHFIEVCLDARGRVWVMLHSGSRGIGNRIGQLFIELAREDMRRHLIHLPDRDLAYLSEGTEHFDAYVKAMSWAQDYAAENRRTMMDSVLCALREEVHSFERGAVAVDCHHNYVARETHFGEACWVTRKGAVRAGRGELGIIPGSMGARSYIVRGLGNAESFESCSHGAGRRMSRTQARRSFTLKDHAGAYKDIDAVMAAQRDLVETVATLKQVLCVKG